ncbi:MAG: hypothetical protein DRP51_00480 [Candidatus Zixiibacteriota bacterium]|nr:MAG: hypothetical protein DRP51_00480 [candidate division Zixibacteria bacterium]HHI02918.1 anti-sigma factor antagonist [candidate division Zixibacteria bacterium]
MAGLKISISEEVPSNITIVDISGIIDALTVSDLEKVLTSIVASDSRGIILNLSSVDYISTAGWSAFITAAREIHKKNREIVLTNMIPNVSENYYLLEFDKIIKSFENIKEAKHLFGETGE